MKTRTSFPSDSISVGKTPLLNITGLSDTLRKVRLYAKAEWHNPGGSVKDRAALKIISEAERDGRLTKKKILLDATSGNTGIAYSWICARLGYRLKLVVPKSINAERKAIFRAFGTDLVLTDPLESSDGAIREAQRLAREHPKDFFYADQYNNDANWRAHAEGTAQEIYLQTEGAVTHFVTGLGTSGTFVGTSRGLREHRADIRCLSVEPDGPLHGLEGLKHMETAIIPGIYDPEIADEKLSVSTEDGQEMARRLARTLGILIGPSGGANLKAALDTAEQLEKDGQTATVVTVLPDSGERYLSEEFWKL